jgi:hypothetical protein
VLYLRLRGLARRYPQDKQPHLMEDVRAILPTKKKRVVFLKKCDLSIFLKGFSVLKSENAGTYLDFLK